MKSHSLKTPISDSGTQISHTEKTFLILLLLSLFLLTIFFVNPFREEVTDDDFAYVLTVHHLIETGQYKLNDWLAPNMPFQAYWGWLNASILGDHFSTYTVSTLIIALLGCIAFFQLSREHDLDEMQAALLTLALFSSPLFLRFSFSFMSDVFFLSLLIIAMLFYTQAIRTKSYKKMLFASLVAGAAILTRQIGVLIIPALLITQFFRKDWRDQWLLTLCGTILPVLAAIWQSSSFFSPPTWAFLYNRHLQSLYSSHVGMLVANAVWRLTIIPQYLALFCLPFAVSTLIFLRSERAPSTGSKHRFLRGFAFIVLLFLIFIAETWVSGKWLIPQLNWSPETFQNRPIALRIAISVISFVGGILFVRIVTLRYFASEQTGTISIPQRMLDLVTLFFLLFHLIFWRLFDRYLIVFLPFTLIVVGRYLRDYLTRFRWILGGAFALQLLVSATWTHVLVAKAEANWRAAEMVRTSGVSPIQIFGSWPWNSYYTFYDYLNDIHYGLLDEDMTQDYFERWFNERKKAALFWITDQPQNARKDWRIMTTVPARSMILNDYRVYILKKEN